MALGRLLIDHAHAAFGLLGADATDGDAAAVVKWAVANNLARFNKSAAQKAMEGRFNSVSKLNKAIERLEAGDVVEGVEVVHADAMLLTVTENGYGKRTPFDDYRSQKRGGKGMIANDLTEKTGDLVTALSVHASDAIMIVTKKGTMIRMPVDGVRVTGRSAQGVKLIDLAEGDVVTVEPGVYYEGRGGIRVEDDYLITADGATLLTGFPRDLVVL